MDAKKFFSTLGVAILGGFITLGAYKYFENKSSNFFEEQSFNSQAIPTNYLKEKEVITPDFIEAAESTTHGVVHVLTKYKQKSSVYDQFFGLNNPFNDFFGLGPNGNVNRTITAAGSGVIISDDGYIATNNHVVQEADNIEITLNDKRTFTAKIIGTDPTTDLALLKIDAKNLESIKFGNSDYVRIGEWVLAVGNPFNLTSTVTAGIISAKARNINILGSSSAVESFIQTDAAVNQGNSGGALVNTKGELIGINAAIASNTGNYTGYSFAIPSNLVRKVMDDLLEFGQVQRAYLGINILDINSSLAEEKKLSNMKGVYVQGVVDKGSAHEVGIKEGDIIIQVNGMEVNSKSELIEQIAIKRPGDLVNITINRSGNNKNFKVTLKNRDGNTGVVKRDEKSFASALGGYFESVSHEDLAKLNIDYGLRIAKMDGGKLRSAGIREGFIITHIDKKPIKSVEDLENALRNKKGGVLFEGIYPNGMRAYYGFGM